MKIKLSAKNVINYLLHLNLCTQKDQNKFYIEPINNVKNFNLLVTCPDNNKLLVKQEVQSRKGQTAGEFIREWRIQSLLLTCSELNQIGYFIPEILHFDSENSIIIYRWLDNYHNLIDFYYYEKSFPREIPSSIGTILATLHRSTFNCQKYQRFFSQYSDNSVDMQIVPQVIRLFNRISPEIFGQVPPEGLKFYALYQRYDSLEQAMEELGEAFRPGCVTHNDLKLNNVLLNSSWRQLDEQDTVRLIDWERSDWGDPAFDLGMLISGYLQIWLNNLAVSQSISIEESLCLTKFPLEMLQPSMLALTQTYLSTFPEILKQRPDFLQRVVQFAGFVLILQIRSMIQHEKSFNNTGIAMLQVAKTLLCRPQQSMPTIFGTDATKLTQFSFPTTNALSQ